jgi:hypothetical protein
MPGKVPGRSSRSVSPDGRAADAPGTRIKMPSPALIEAGTRQTGAGDILRAQENTSGSSSICRRPNPYDSRAPGANR